MRTALYIAACIVIPAVWGLVASWAYDRIAARHSASHEADEDSADMFYI